MSDDLGVHLLTADASHFRWVGVRTSQMGPLSLLLRGEPIGERWQPPVVYEISDPELPDAPLSDFPYFNGTPLVGPRAMESLRDVWAECGELLPVHGLQSPHMVLNVTRVLDALDESRSTLTRFESSGRVMSVERYAFHRSRLGRCLLFRIPQLPQGDIFVTDAFVARVRAAKLTGFEFERVA